MVRALSQYIFLAFLLTTYLELTKAASNKTSHISKVNTTKTHPSAVNTTAHTKASKTNKTSTATKSAKTAKPSATSKTHKVSNTSKAGVSASNQSSMSVNNQIVTSNSSNSSSSSSNYSYNNKGDDWTGTCQTGQLQSPINIQVVKGTCDNSMVLDVQFDNTNLSVGVQMTGETIMSTGGFSNLYATDINGNLYGYTAQYMIFHSPSEHSISGTFYDMEMQIFHQLKVSQLNIYESDFSSTYTYNQAVLSVLFKVSSKDQPFFDAYNFGAASNLTLNFSALLGGQINENPTYYTYQGSQTVPGCSETVNWYILDTILPISQTQLNSFTQYFSSNQSFANGNGNERDIQSTNNRLVKQGGVQCQEQFVYFFSFFILYIFINYFIFKLL